MTILFIAISNCFSLVAFGQNASASEIKLDQEAKLEIDRWMETHFILHKGKRYVLPDFQKFEDLPGNVLLNPEERRISYDFGDDLYYYGGLVELTNVSGWKVDKENITVRTIDKLNNAVVDEWRGKVKLLTNGEAISRTFGIWKWDSYVEGYGNIPVEFFVKKRGGTWTFTHNAPFKLRSPNKEIIDATLTEQTFNNRKYGEYKSMNFFKAGDVTGYVGSVSFKNNSTSLISNKSEIK